MVTEALIHAALAVTGWFASLFPTWTPPDEMLHLDTTVNGFLAQFAGIGPWIPWALVITCAGIALGTWAVCLGVKAVRAIASHIPLVGGSG